MVKKPKVKERGPISSRVLTKMLDFVDTFINGVPTIPKVYDIGPDVISMAAEE